MPELNPTTIHIQGRRHEGDGRVENIEFELSPKGDKLVPVEEKVPEGTKVAGCVLCEEGKPHIHNFF